VTFRGAVSLHQTREQGVSQMNVINPDHMIFVALLNGNTERAMGMAHVAALYSDDADGNAVIERIKAEAFERMLNVEGTLVVPAHPVPAHLTVDQGVSLDELVANTPPIAAPVQLAVPPIVAPDALMASIDAAEVAMPCEVVQPVAPVMSAAEDEEMLF